MTKIKPKEMGVKLYKSADGDIQMEVKLEKDTLWLTQAQIAKLFSVEVPAISKHISNIYKTGELSKPSTLSKMEIVQTEGSRSIKRNSDVYSLDLIISVGYRVNSQKATQFRIWATKVLKNHLVHGFTINEKTLLDQKNKLKELQNVIYFIESKSHQSLLENQSAELLAIISHYTKSLDLLEQYDKNKIKIPRGSMPLYNLSFPEIVNTITNIKIKLAETKKNLGFFGIESSNRLAGIVGNISQTFDGKDLYKTTEEKAANLFYMIIKDHPFIDGNKRIGSLVFIQYLERNNILYRRSGERKINDNTLVALALLVAISKPTEKSILINVIINIVS